MERDGGDGGGGGDGVSHHSDGERETEGFVGVYNVRGPIGRIDCINRINTGGSRESKGGLGLYTKFGS
jgi:hypothetical protein